MKITILLKKKKKSITKHAETLVSFSLVMPPTQQPRGDKRYLTSAPRFKLILRIQHSLLLSFIISWQACEDSHGGFTVMNLYSTTRNNSHKGTSGDVIVFNLIRSNCK